MSKSCLHLQLVIIIRFCLVDNISFVLFCSRPIPVFCVGFKLLKRNFHTQFGSLGSG